MEYSEIALDVLAATPDALLLSDGDIEKWVPISQMKDPNKWHTYISGRPYDFEIANWILEEKGFI